MDGLDLAAFRVTPSTRDPFPYVVVTGFIKPDAGVYISADYPRIDSPGSSPFADFSFGAGFQGLLDGLGGPAFRRSA
jgi:SM-20-related protein